MTATIDERPRTTFSPRLEPGDPLAIYWLRQVSLRLRREIAWRWHEQGGSPPVSAGPLIPATRDPIIDALDRGRFVDDQRHFFAEDPTGRYLSELLAAPPPDAPPTAERGSFAWVCEALDLSPVARFTLAFALHVSWDSASRAVIAACSADSSADRPTLALLQRLWDEPREVLEVADPAHPLYTHGLVTRGDGRSPGLEWEEPLSSTLPVTRRLLAPELPPSPALFEVGETEGPSLRARGLRALAEALRLPPSGLQVIPVLAPAGEGIPLAARATAQAGRRLVVYRGPARHLTSPGRLDGLAAAAWLDDVDLLIPAADLPDLPQGGRLLPLSGLPLRLFVVAEGHAELRWIPAELRGTTIEALPSTYDERLDAWRRGLGEGFADLEGAALLAAHRFRLCPAAISAVTALLSARSEAPTAADVEAACVSASAQGRLDASGLADRIEPRFALDELILPGKQDAQLGELRRAVAALPRAFGAWGLGPALGNPGISALFAGPPGTGKTMAAECLAAELDLPLYRVDLSQVVSKYIGETEKNLREVFAAAEARDLVLFFDEADAIFGKRTEVRDAHDRYANLEVSYLLARMEQAQGLMILATNRKEDLDPAFLRRLRFIVDFPMPGADERREIWERVVPAMMDRSELDLGFLAKRFDISGGTIRSAAVAACLQSAAEGGPPKLRMEQLILALWRELDKLGRALSPALFGPFAAVIEAAEAEHTGGRGR